MKQEQQTLLGWRGFSRTELFFYRILPTGLGIAYVIYLIASLT